MMTWKLTDDQILDFPLDPPYNPDLAQPSPYAIWVFDSEDVDRIIQQWYVDVYGRMPALSDLKHAQYRYIEERKRWGTLRRALQDTWPKPVPPSPVPVLRPWRQAGLNFVNDADQIEKVRGLTAFDAYRMWLNGRTDELKRYADFTHGLGADVWRIFTMWQITGFRSTPATRARIPEFNDWLHGIGIRPWFVAFCDQTDQYPAILLPRDEQDEHWQAVSPCAGPRTLVEVVNEFWQNGGFELSNRYDIGGKLACRSAVPDGSGDPREAGSLGQLTNDHTPRDNEYSRKFKVLLETARLGGGPKGAEWRGTGLPAVGGEPPQLQAMTPEGSADLFAGYELYGQGGIIHDGHKLGEETGLQFCKVPDNQNELDCIEAIRQSWGVVPPELAANGTYSRDGVNNDVREFPIVRCESALRTYGMIYDNGSKAVVLCPGGTIDNSGVEAVNGWRIVDRRGYKGRVLFAER